MTPVEDDVDDLTRKQRREQAREQRKAMEEAEAQQAVRRTRLRQLAIAVTVVVVAIVAIAVAAGGSSKKAPPKEGSTAERQAVAAVVSTVGGVRQSGNVLGSPTAPVTLVYFGDLQCPICKDFTLGALPSVIQQWVKSGKLRIEYRAMQTATHEQETFKNQQVAALAAGKQNGMWYYLELFYHQQGEENSGYVTEAYLQMLARQVPGLNVAKWANERGNPELASQVAADGQAANNAGFTGTPSFLLGRTGGALKKFEAASLKDPSSFNQAIEALVKG
jgi:protein-disulfide isomerase